MFERLNDVDWSALRHAYGAASDVPEHIRGLASPEREERKAAMHALSACICHQSSVYPASARAVPFLIELLDAGQVEDKSAIVQLLVEIALGPPEPLFRKGIPVPWWTPGQAPRDAITSSYVEARKGASCFVGLLDHPDTSVRLSAIALVSGLRDAGDRARPRLRALIAGADSEVIRASALLALSLLGCALGDREDAALATSFARNDPSLMAIAASIGAAYLMGDSLPDGARALLESTLRGNPRRDPAFPFYRGEISTLARAALAMLGGDSAVTALANALATTGKSDLFEVANELCRLVFGERRPERPLLAERLSASQRKTLDAIANLSESAVDQLDTLLRSAAVPQGRARLRAYLGLEPPTAMEERVTLKTASGSETLTVWAAWWMLWHGLLAPDVFLAALGPLSTEAILATALDLAQGRGSLSILRGSSLAPSGLFGDECVGRDLLVDTAIQAIARRGDEAPPLLRTHLADVIKTLTKGGRGDDCMIALGALGEILHAREEVPDPKYDRILEKAKGSSRAADRAYLRALPIARREAFILGESFGEVFYEFNHFAYQRRWAARYAWWYVDLCKTAAVAARIVQAIVSLPRGRWTIEEEAMPIVIGFGEVIVPALADALIHGKAARRDLLASALADLARPEGAAALFQAALDKQSSVREHALRGLVRLEFTSLAPHLRDALASKKKPLRIASATVLGKLSPTDAVRAFAKEALATEKDRAVASLLEIAVKSRKIARGAK